MSDSPTIIVVCVRSPLWRTLDYLLPAEAHPPKPGTRVVVPLGKRMVVGWVLSVKQQTDCPLDRLKPIDQLIDEAPLMTPSIMQLLQWTSDYYHYPLGEVYYAMLPTVFYKGKPIKLKACETDLIETSEQPPALNPAQQTAVDEITKASGFSAFLLHGITGSGKTEVYLRVIEDCLKHNKQALVLVPEIALTPQTLQRFQSRFNVPIALWHSQLTPTQRQQAWCQANADQAKIIIGTRSAVFIPMQQPGVIILDEEHDLSFKQQSGLRYSARDLAVMRASLENISVILGSATPSIKSLYNVECNRYHYLHLPERAGLAQPPKISLVDLRQQSLTSGLTDQVFSAIDRHLAAEGQVLLFLNRRGYAPVMLCHHCGHSECCPHCDARLTWHQQAAQLICHHCEYRRRLEKICSNCHQSDLMPVGQGTEKLEQTLSTRYGGSVVVRIDRDTTRRKGEMDKLLSLVHNNDAKILIGTQMLAKGHHFTNLSLVVIVDADSGLMSVDFRAIERLGQLLIQVSGRAGRAEKAGEVLIQTHQPDHPQLQLLLREGYLSFAQEILQERQAAALPPYQYFALLRADDRFPDKPIQTLDRLKAQLHSTVLKQVQLLGPMASPMERRAGRYRAQLLLQSKSRQALQLVLEQLMQVSKREKNSRWTLDVDPLELL